MRVCVCVYNSSWVSECARECVCLLPAVGGGAPAAVRISSEPPPEHELLVFLHEEAVSEDHADVMGVEALRTLGAADVHAAL